MTLLLRLIAGLETWGGAVGLVMVIDNTDFSSPAAELVLAGLAASFFAMSLGAGVLLFRGHRLGVSLSIITNAFQVVSLTVGTVVYHLHSGAVFSIGLKSGIATLAFGLTSEYRLSLLRQSQVSSFTVNIVAIVVLAVLVQVLRLPHLMTSRREPNIG